MAVGATNLLFTIVGMSIIDKAGRRVLLLTGAIGTAVALAGVAYIFATQRNQALLVWLLIGYIAFFALSQGAVIWVYISEVFPTRVRAKGQSLGSFTHWAMNAAISGTFPLFAASSGSAPFVFFSVMMVLQFFVVFSSIPRPREYRWNRCRTNSRSARRRTFKSLLSREVVELCVCVCVVGSIHPVSFGRCQMMVSVGV